MQHAKRDGTLTIVGICLSKRAMSADVPTEHTDSKHSPEKTFDMDFSSKTLN